MKSISVILLLFLPILIFGQTDEAKLLGSLWFNEKKEAKVKFYKKDGKYFGDVIWLLETLGDVSQPLYDLNNPDPELRTRRILNMPLIEEMSYKNGEWDGGTAYNPRSGRYFKCRMWFEGDDILKVRGYWGLLFGTETWTKAPR